MLGQDDFNKAKFNQIESKVKELDNILERSLPPNHASMKARERLQEALMWAEWGLLRNR